MASFKVQGIIKEEWLLFFLKTECLMLPEICSGEYICMDPLKDTYTTLKDYSNRIYSVRCVWYEP